MKCLFPVRGQVISKGTSYLCVFSLNNEEGVRNQDAGVRGGTSYSCLARRLSAYARAICQRASRLSTAQAIAEATPPRAVRARFRLPKNNHLQSSAAEERPRTPAEPADMFFCIVHSSRLQQEFLATLRIGSQDVDGYTVMARECFANDFPTRILEVVIAIAISLCACQDYIASPALDYSHCVKMNLFGHLGRTLEVLSKQSQNDRATIRPMFSDSTSSIANNEAY